MKMVRVFGALALAMFAVTLASAQATGGLKIRVIDNSDKSEVIGAAVTLSNTNKLVATSSIITGADGVALFPVLRAGQGYDHHGHHGWLRRHPPRRRRHQRHDQRRRGRARPRARGESRRHRPTRGQQVDLDSTRPPPSSPPTSSRTSPVAGRFYQNVLSLAPAFTTTTATATRT